MSKFNKKKEVKATTNYMGARAFKQEAHLELAGLLLTSFAEDSYYEKANKTVDRLKGLIEKCDPEFVAKACVFARTQFGMRSITHVTASELAKHASGKEWAKGFYNKIVHRPDDMMEILSYYSANCAEKRKKGGYKYPNSIINGFKEAFNRFDGYALAKYRGQSKDISLVDVANIVHPAPVYRNADALKKLMKGELKSTEEGNETWEALLTEAGANGKTEAEKAKNKKAVWVKLLKEGKLKIFATLRNLRNIVQQAPEAIDMALEVITDEKKIKKSLILPFRYLSAYGEIEKLRTEATFEKDVVNVDKILKAIERALEISIQNLPTLEGRTLILSDNSGSMRGDSGGGSMVSAMSKTKTADIANLFAVMYWTKADNTLVGLFGDRLTHPKMDRSKGIFHNFKTVDRDGANVGGGTEAGIFEMFRKMIKDKIICDTIVVFSDCQIGDGCAWYGTKSSEYRGNFDALYKEYRKINPKFRIYSIDLKNYGTTVFDGSVIKISGWSEKIFEVMKYAEKDKDALINEILEVELMSTSDDNVPANQ